VKRSFRFGVLIFLLAHLPAKAQGPANVLVVVNTTSKISQEVGEYYRQKRAIPAGQVCRIAAPDREHIDRAAFDNNIRQPLMGCLRNGGLQDRVLYLVLTKGVPLVVDGQPGLNGDQASVDSELTLLYQDMISRQHPVRGKVVNPYYLKNSRTSPMVRFSHKEFPIYLVTRLDGYDVEGVKALIDRGLRAKPEGRFLLDLKQDDETPGNTWLRQTADRLRAAGIAPSRVVLEQSRVFVTGEKNLLGYASWGSNDPANTSRFLKHTWEPGALLAEFVSSDGRTFERPPDGWNIGKWDGPRSGFYKNTPQSLIADYLSEGVTGAAGYVDEPYLPACARPQILFPAYASGLNLAESFYSSLPDLSWKAVVVGDPLVQPFPRPPLSEQEANPAIDPGTKLPEYFSRQLVGLRSRFLGERADVIELLLTAERHREEGDLQSARAAAEQALSANPDSLAALNTVAALSTDKARSVSLYRKVVERSPRNFTALNNLAYTLATSGRLEEAFPLAARAMDITQGGTDFIQDTYGWVLYLRGDYAAALVHLEKAASSMPANAAVAYHVGMCLLKLGRNAEGRAHLERALALNPDAETAAAVRKAL